MKKLIILILAAIFISPVAFAADKAKKVTKPSGNYKYYSTHLCSNPAYECVKVKSGQSWKKLFPDEKQMDIVQRVNRTNMRLWTGKTIAIPKDLENLTLYDVSPFPNHIAPHKTKVILVDQEKLAWGAYDRSGKLIKWGPISSGKNYCGDIGRSCNTQTGIFHIFHKKDKRCVSKVFPVGRGGAKMPYCMFYYRGYALHGSHEVPGSRQSHGCIRLFTRDAKWLNQEFVELSIKENNYKGTTVIVQDLNITKGKKE